MTATLSFKAPVLVAGGTGFLGSHLCERLVAERCDVICIDSFVTGKLRNVESIVDSPRFTLRYHDVTEPLAHAEVAGIFNLACAASPVHYQADPIHTTLTSVRGTHNLLELARLTQATLLQASTSEVYGDPTVHPQPEHYWGHVNPTGRRACYDEGKRCAESLCFDYQRKHGVDVRVARIFNTYGPRMQADDGRVVSNFIVQALRNEPLTVYGKGEQTRSFCYVDDLIEALVRFMAAPRSVRSPMNLGNPEEFTIRELAELVLDVTGSRSKLMFLPLPSDDPTQRCPDIGHARRELGWEPRVKLREGLVRTVAYFDALLGGRHERARRRLERAAGKAKLHAARSVPAAGGSGERQVSHAQG